MTKAYSRRLDKWKLTLAVTPRAGVNTVDNIITKLGYSEPRKMPQRGPLNGYLNVKFFRNPFARAVSSFIIQRDAETFIDFLDVWLPKHLHEDHYGPQFNPGDKKQFICIKIEEFYKFVNVFNEFGNHSFKVSDFRAGHVMPKVNLEGPLHNTPLREILTRCNPNHPNPLHMQLPHIPYHEAFYTDEVKIKVERIFGNDIAQMGYTFEGMVSIEKPEDLTEEPS